MSIRPLFVPLIDPLFCPVIRPLILNYMRPLFRPLFRPLINPLIRHYLCMRCPLIFAVSSSLMLVRVSCLLSRQSKNKVLLETSYQKIVGSICGHDSGQHLWAAFVGFPSSTHARPLAIFLLTRHGRASCVITSEVALLAFEIIHQIAWCLPVSNLIH